jgi:hypothetical protein
MGFFIIFLFPINPIGPIIFSAQQQICDFFLEAQHYNLGPHYRPTQLKK